MSAARFAFAALLLLLAPMGALAHEFDVAILAPLSGAQAPDGQAALQGFRTATREQDGHTDETSDGHLGGLDVQMRPVDTAAGTDPAAALAALGPPPVILVVAAQADDLRRLLSQNFPGSVVIGPGVLPDGAPAEDGDFAGRYGEEHGQRPDLAAARGYNGARRIAQAVRAQGGVGDIAALRRDLAATADGIDW